MTVQDTSGGGRTFRRSAASRAVEAELRGAIEAGNNLPGALIFPDSDAGNEALCRVAASSKAMPQDPSTQAQAANQAPAIETYFYTPSTNTVADRLGNITVPVLVLQGAQDWVIPPENARVLAAAIPAASLVVFADAGHGAVLQKEAAVATLVSAFLDADLADASQADIEAEH